MQNHQSTLNLAIELARGAGEILRDGQIHGFGDVDTKVSSVDIVTEVDKASEQFLVDQLAKHRPNDGVLGEEGASVASSSGVRWVVDPLDGTVNYTYGFPIYAVSIGVEVSGERIVGVVYNPALDELFTAIRGEGAFLNGAQIHVNQETDLGQSLVATGFSYLSETRRKQAEALVAVLPEIRDLRRAGSAALDLCSVACGRLDAYFEPSVKPWDVAAGDLIASEAGAKVTGFTSDEVVSDVIAANPSLHPVLLSLVSQSAL